MTINNGVVTICLQLVCAIGCTTEIGHTGPCGHGGGLVDDDAAASGSGGGDGGDATATSGPSHAMFPGCDDLRVVADIYAPFQFSCNDALPFCDAPPFCPIGYELRFGNLQHSVPTSCIHAANHTVCDDTANIICCRPGADTTPIVCQWNGDCPEAQGCSASICALDAQRCVIDAALTCP